MPVDQQSPGGFFSQKTLREKCAVFGIYTKSSEAAQLTYYGLWALQHRGQDSSGISATDGTTIRTKKDEGLVAYVYSEEDIDNLKGYAAIGHNRYGTSGGVKGVDHAQPVTSASNLLTLGHNGNLPSTVKLEAFFKDHNIDSTGLNDSELMHGALEYCMQQGDSIEDAVKKCFPLFTGAFCLVILTKDKVVAVRDAFGVRPLSLGKFARLILYPPNLSAM